MNKFLIHIFPLGSPVNWIISRIRVRLFALLSSEGSFELHIDVLFIFRCWFLDPLQHWIEISYPGETFLANAGCGESNFLTGLFLIENIIMTDNKYTDPF